MDEVFSVATLNLRAGYRRWICIQNGAREHYAIPRALKQSDRLEALFTEVWAGPWLRRLAFGPLRPLAMRFHPELADVRVIRWTWAWLLRQLNSKSEIGNVKLGKQSEESKEVYARFIREGRWFSEKIQGYLSRRKTDIRGRVLFSYDTTALELFRWARGRGAFCVLGQMDPGRMETKLVREEERLWPGWALYPISVPDEYHQRREQEWLLADCIVVNSRWSFEALVQQGVPPEKVSVIPLCYEIRVKGPKSERQKAEIENRKPDDNGSPIRFSVSHPLRVLFLGQVILRKGIQYVVEAAKLLQDEPVVFDVVGPVGITNSAMTEVPRKVRFHGRTGRDAASSWYRQADVFVLPTVSDGFAITQIEAMAHGLPVITTPNCGEVVTDGVDGFIVPARNGVALAGAIQRYLAEPELLPAQSAAALAKAKQFTSDKLIEELLILEKELAMKA